MTRKEKQERLAIYLFKHLDLFFEIPIFIDGEMTQYTIRIDGTVISYKGYNSTRPRKIKPIVASNGYHKVNISFKGKEKLVSVHRLVAQAFIPNPENKPEVNHKDGNKSHNYAWNLEWSTSKENIDHAFRTGLKKGMVGDEHPSRKISSDIAKLICELLQTGKCSMKEIADKTNSTYSIVKKIKNRERWKEISSSYDFSNYKRR